MNIKFLTLITASLLIFTSSCVPPPPAPTTARFLVGEPEEESVIASSEEPDTDCSYFYFLWGRTSEAAGRYDEALEAYEKAVVCDEQAEYVVRHIASLLLRMGRKKQAVAWVEKLMASKPYDPQVKIFLADLYGLMGDFSRSEEIYQAVLAKDRKNISLMFKLGKLYLNNLDYTRARNIFERLVRIAPDSFIGHYYLAKLYQELKFYQKSFASYKKVLALNWSAALAIETADLYVEQELFDEAIALYRKVLAEDEADEAAAGRLVRTYLEMNLPGRALDLLQELREEAMDSQKIDFTIGRIFMEQKEYDKAIKLFKEMVERYPDLDVAKALLALAHYENGDLKEAEKLLLLIDRNTKGYDEALYMLVKMYAEGDDYDAAISLVRKAITENGKDSINYYSVLALLYEENKKLDEAENVFKEAVKRFAESPEVYFKYGMFLERTGRLQEAMVQMEKVLALNPDDAYALNYVGYSWAEQGVNLEKALQYITKAVDLRPDDGFIRDSLGWVYFKLGKFERAIIELEKAIKEEPDDPTIREHLGDVFSGLSQVKKALAQYAKSLQLFDDGADKERVSEKIRKVEGVKGE